MSTINFHSSLYKARLTDRAHHPPPPPPQALVPLIPIQITKYITILPLNMPQRCMIIALPSNPLPIIISFKNVTREHD
jgi:hypothetical protein